VATPNYGFEKRQRELAKRKKKEEKLRSKAERKQGDPGEGGASDGDAPTPGMPVHEQPPQL